MEAVRVYDEGKDGLEVGLVEAGEDLVGVVGAHVGVEVNLAVEGVLELVEARTVGGVARGELDVKLVGTCWQIAQGQLVTGTGGRQGTRV